MILVLGDQIRGGGGGSCRRSAQEIKKTSSAYSPTPTLVCVLLKTTFLPELRRGQSIYILSITALIISNYNAAFNWNWSPNQQASRMAQISDVQKQMASQPRFACTAKHTSAPSITQLWYHVVLNAPDGCGCGEGGREDGKRAGERRTHNKCAQISRRRVGIWPTAAAIKTEVAGEGAWAHTHMRTL